MTSATDTNQSLIAPHIILTDADYIDRVAFDLIVNFERMIGRRIPQADLCHWLNCVALDSGLRPGAGEIHAHFIYSGQRDRLANFSPSLFEADIHGLHFDDRIGSWHLFAFKAEEVVSRETFFIQSLEMLCHHKAPKSITVVGDMDAYGEKVKQICAQTEGKDITLLAMEPLTGRGFSQEILGYSLLSALGISSDEIQ